MEKIDIDISKFLHDFFGFKKFKGNQKQAIESLMDGNDTFVIMPTGGGKSLCYQLPAIMMDGVAVIISPLIALMKNQVDNVRSYSKNYDIAHFYNSSLNKAELEKVKDAVENGKTKLLFVAPETIAKEKNLFFFKSFKISFFAVDEAHCISEWGHDFRPEYRKLRKIIDSIGRRPIIALTATATKKVKKDIIKNLGISSERLFLSSFNRPNLYYEVQPKIDVDKNLIKFIKKNSGKSGIIYCLSRKKSEEVSELLNINNIKSLPYHAGLDQSTRNRTQEDFLMEEIDVVVATIAFGMGIDKPDVRYVIHYNLPKSLENYYQETGRAGRDGGEGHCLLYYDPGDVEKFELFNSKKNLIEKEINTQLLEEIVTYVESEDCRRKKILHYFGEKYQISNCDDCCDKCNNNRPSRNVKSLLVLILKCIVEVGNKFTTKQITQILHGLAKYIDGTDIQNLKSYKRLDHEDVFLTKQIIRKAIVEDLIVKNIEQGGKLNLTEEGKIFTESPKSFYIIETIDSPVEISNKNNSNFDKALVLILKDIRKRIAKKLKVPPFIIFQDPSIDDMSIQYPTNIDELRNIIGVGKGKAEKFGKDFTDAIAKHVEINNITRPIDFQVKSKPKKNDLKIFIIQSADRKIDFDEIIEQKNISGDELLDEIENIVNSGTKINIDYHIDEILDQQQQEEIKNYFMNEAKDDSISNALIHFDDEYEEFELRLIRIKLFSDLAN
tara:strand:+ start:10911 stop:13079 length:2169 start_codon:yes stop_codon:yes gene_type:complete